MSDISYKQYKQLIEDNLLKFMPPIDSHSQRLYESMEYSLLAGGKRLRPVLILAAYNLCGNDITEALPYACAAEYIHTYSLIHDDLPALDNDDFRRGKATNHKVFGENIGILAGDGLLSAAFEIMTKDMALYVNKNTKLQRRALAIKSIAEGTGVEGMVSGQVADVISENTNCDKALLSFIHANKTKAFIKSCVMTGALLGGAEVSVLNDLESFGENFGLAFQIVDDILDVISTTEDLGHSIGKDSQQNKCTYPAIYGLDESIKIADDMLSTAIQSIEKYGTKSEVFIYAINSLKERIHG